MLYSPVDDTDIITVNMQMFSKYNNILGKTKTLIKLQSEIFAYNI